ncbi:AAA family ATPase [Microbacterium sp. SSW1-59]|uniref:AAA family ATPase n=1 Tax=Microbacterium xanthum TaxID=3079794 RepID=UPI002AD324C3|nr:AAA family ATPase [Microbacterium sp. SSW1-59]MDZ8202048.1 AAA family ATPase [Microbacterium sp. SSW1-59]
MRIVVSGTHAIGKSTLIGDFAAAHREYEVLPDPFELIDAAADEPDASTYLAQLRIAADRLLDLSPGDDVIAERGPLDFLAYLVALDDLGRIDLDADVLSRATALTEEAMTHVDLLVLLPITANDGIRAPEDEDPGFRQAMNDALSDLVDDAELLGSARVAEITGQPPQRLHRLRVEIGQGDRSERSSKTLACPMCGDRLSFEILDDEKFLVAWSCVICGLVRTTEPA